MDADRPLVISLNDPAACQAGLTGGKAANLARLIAAGARVPTGFVVTVATYERFVAEAGLGNVIRMELGRKAANDMRWEELWDAALRVRARFRAAPIPAGLRRVVCEAVADMGDGQSLAVRSSAVGEDSGGRSFAGLHESVVGVRGGDAVLDAMQVVWASLWSDASLLYRRELSLDPATSVMAVVVQEVVVADRSGVAFGRHPTKSDSTLVVIEAVPGPCQLLVDGVVEPDRWELDRTSGHVTEWAPGVRNDEVVTPLLEPPDLHAIVHMLAAVEDWFGWPPDMEWTGRHDRLTVLQARPITMSRPEPRDRRSWYRTLTPSDARLRSLRTRVAGELIPELESEGGRLAAEDLSAMSDAELSEAVDERCAALARWRRVYEDDFIPFAHGVRRLGTYYNDAVRPDDPYEFVGLLQSQPLLATRRNAALAELALELIRQPPLRAAATALLEAGGRQVSWARVRQELETADHGAAFVDRCEGVSLQFWDITFKHARLRNAAGMLLSTVVELARRGASGLSVSSEAAEARSSRLMARLNASVGPTREAEAVDVVDTARVSWRLRDDDNLLVARIESQLLRALETAADRLRAVDRLATTRQLDERDATTISKALREAQTGMVELPAVGPSPILPGPADSDAGGERSRQLIGQPASVGLATGRARHVRALADLGTFRLGEVLVCDAIQPTMTHLVPLACGIVERRGGMLIHGAIIARELGIPCVNGVPGVEDLRTGDVVTVDGHLGIVTVGEAEFDLEYARAVGV